MMLNDAGLCRPMSAYVGLWTNDLEGKNDHKESTSHLDRTGTAARG
jgi:hypothetical protein